MASLFLIQRYFKRWSFFPNRIAVVGSRYAQGFQGGSANRNYNVPPCPSTQSALTNTCNCRTALRSDPRARVRSAHRDLPYDAPKFPEWHRLRIRSR